MTTFLDTNILIDVTQPDAATYAWSVEQLTAAKERGPVYVSDIVYSEFSTGMGDVAETDATIEALALARCGYSNEVLFRAAKAFKQYRNNTPGTKANVLPDFLIGALAEIEGKPLLTRDAGKVATYFPTVEIIGPAK